jgi:SAM-dependent methyltransferase
MRLADRISLRSRRRKFGLFMETMGPTAETSVLDVGVDDLAFGDLSENEGSCGTLNFFEDMYPWPERLTAVGLHEGDRFRTSYPNARYVQGNALELPFEDASFDVVFSNAVIEHVGGEDEQRRFVAEALRVAPRAFITTPNRWFPIEASHRAYDLARKPWAKRNRLLGPGSFEELFPGDVRIVNLGMTLVAVVDE